MVFGLALVHHFCNSSATYPREGLLADFKRYDVFKRPLIYGEMILFWTPKVKQWHLAMWTRIKSIMARPYKIELVNWIIFERNYFIDFFEFEKKMCIFENS